MYVALDLSTGSLLAVKELNILDIPADDQRAIEQEVHDAASYVTRHTSLVTHHTSHSIHHTSHSTHHTAYITHYSSHVRQVRALSIMQHSNIVSYIGTQVTEHV